MEKKPAILVDRPKLAFALILTEELIFCNTNVFYTGNEGYFIAIFNGTLPPITTEFSANREENLGVMMDTLTKLILLEKNIESSLTDMVNHLEQKLCLNRRLDIMNLLSLARVNTEEFAYNLMEGPGYHSEIRGELIYILNCQPVNIPLRPVNKTCFQEIPVVYQNKSMFARPKSRIITEVGTQIDCDPFLPGRYRLGNDWYVIYPTRNKMPRP